MEAVEEILPRITEFLRDELARENLSHIAERTRLFYVERIEATLLEARARRGSSISSESSYKYHCRGSKIPAVNDSSKNNEQSSAYYNSKPVNKSRCTSSRDQAKYIEQTKTDTYDEVLIASPGKQQLSSYSNEGDRESNSIDNEDSGTDYESYEGSSESLNDLYDQIGPAAALGGSLDSRQTPRVSGRRSTKKKASTLPSTTEAGDITRAGHLYHKGMVMMTKWYCRISGPWLQCFANEKEQKPLLALKLIGYEAFCTEKDSKQVYHEMKLTCPGRNTHWFYATESEYLQDWAKDLNQAANPHSPTSLSTLGPPTPQRNATVSRSPQPEVDEMYQSATSENGSGGTVDKDLIARIERIASGKLASTGSDVGKKTAYMMKTLKNTFGRKKNRVERRLPTNWTENPDPALLVADFMEIAFGFKEGRPSSLKWEEKFCAVRNGRLEVYKEQEDDRMEFSLLLSGSEIFPPESDTKRQFVLKLCQQQKEIHLSAADAEQHGRWLNILIKETGFASRLTEAGKQNASSSSLPATLSADSDIGGVYIYEEIPQYDPKYTENNPPPLPTCSPPDTVAEDSLLLHVVEDYLEPGSIKMMAQMNVGETNQDDTYMNAQGLQSITGKEIIEKKEDASDSDKSKAIQPKALQEVPQSSSEMDERRKSNNSNIVPAADQSATATAKASPPFSNSNISLSKLLAISRLSQSDDAISKLENDMSSSLEPSNARGDIETIAARSASTLDVKNNYNTNLSKFSGETGETSKDVSNTDLSNEPTESSGEKAKAYDYDTAAPITVKLKADESYIANSNDRRQKITQKEKACIRNEFVKDRLKLFQGK